MAGGVGGVGVYLMRAHGQDKARIIRGMFQTRKKISCMLPMLWMIVLMTFLKK